MSLLLLSHTQGARTAHTSGRIKCSQTMISTSISQNKGKKKDTREKKPCGPCQF